MGVAEWRSSDRWMSAASIATAQFTNLEERTKQKESNNPQQKPWKRIERGHNNRKDNVIKKKQKNAHVEIRRSLSRVASLAPQERLRLAYTASLQRSHFTAPQHASGEGEFTFVQPFCFLTCVTLLSPAHHASSPTCSSSFPQLPAICHAA